MTEQPRVHPGGDPASRPAEEILEELGVSAGEGLSAEEAKRRLVHLQTGR